MNRDPTIFPDFDNFRPERFLDETGTVDIAPPDTHEMGHVTFGFGKRCVPRPGALYCGHCPIRASLSDKVLLYRICVGMHFANQALFINFATILWAMDISKALDEQGQEITPDSNNLIDTGVAV